MTFIPIHNNFYIYNFNSYIYNTALLLNLNSDLAILLKYIKIGIHFTNNVVRKKAVFSLLFTILRCNGYRGYHYEDGQSSCRNHDRKCIITKNVIFEIFFTKQNV